MTVFTLKDNSKGGNHPRTLFHLTYTCGLTGECGCGDITLALPLTHVISGPILPPLLTK